MPMWQFLIGLIVGALIGICLLALVSASPEDDKERRKQG